MKSFLDNFIRKEIPLDGPKIVSHFYTKYNYPTEGYSWNEGEIPEISVSIEQQNIQLERKQVSSTVNKEQIFDLDKIGINAKDVVKSALINEFEISEFNEILKELKTISKEYYIHKNFSGLKRRLFNLIRFRPLKNIHNTNMVRELIYASNKVLTNSKMGGAHFAIVSKEILSYIVDDPEFQFNINTNEISNTTISLVGCLPRHNLYIYETLLMDKCEMILGRKDEHMGIISVKTENEYLEINEFDNYKIRLVWWGKVTSTPNASNIYVKYKYANKDETVISYIINCILQTKLFQNIKRFVNFK